jgi:hypothetical protein
MLSFALVLSLASGPSIIGTWALMGQPFVTLNANGTCSFEGEPCTYKTQGNTLIITAEGESDVVEYSLGGDTLTITVNGIPMQLTRHGMRTAPAPKMPVAGAEARATETGAIKMDLKDPLAKLLVSSAWCSFRFNKTTGYSSTTRAQLFADGTYSLGGKSEGYSSGYGGTMASQANTGSTGKWAVMKGQLYMTPPPSEENPAPTELLPISVVVKKNSNGYPIVVADGTEYSQCQ